MKYLVFQIIFTIRYVVQKKKFIKAWDSIPDENKKNIDIHEAVAMTCIKLSDELFYKDFDSSED